MYHDPLNRLCPTPLSAGAFGIRSPLVPAASLPQKVAAEKALHEPSKKYDRTAEAPVFHVVSLQSSSIGGILLPDGTAAGTSDRIASISLDTSLRRHFLVHLHFCCSIVTLQAKLHLQIQVRKQGRQQASPVPVSSNFYYTRSENSTENNVFCLETVDPDPVTCSYSHYSVNIEVIGGRTVGICMITNPQLTAAILERSS